MNDGKWAPHCEIPLDQALRENFRALGKLSSLSIQRIIMKHNLAPTLSLLALLLLASCDSNPEQTPSSVQNTDKSQTEINAPQNNGSSSNDSSNSGVTGNVPCNSDFPQEKGKTSLNLAQIQAWDTQRIQTLSVQQMSQVPPEYCRRLSSEQLKAFSSNQLLALKFECLIALSQRDSVASLKDLTREQLSSLSHQLRNYFHHLNSDEQLRSITAEQFEDLHKLNGKSTFTPLMLNYFGHRVQKGAEKFNFSKMKPNLRTMDSITESQLSQRHLSDLEYREIFLQIADFSEPQIAAIPEDLIQYLWGLPLLSVSQIKAFTQGQLAKLNAAQWNLLLPFQIEALASNPRLLYELSKMLHSNQDVVRDLSRTFLQTLYPKVTADFVRGMTENMIQDMVVDDLQEGHPWRLHFKAVITHWSQFNTQQLQSIPEHLFRLINLENWNSLRPELVKDLLPQQIRWISSNQISLVLTAKLIPELKGEQIQSLNAKQLKNLICSDEHLNAFEPHQIKYISPKSISRFSEETAFNFIQGKNILLNLTKEQFNSLPKELRNEVQTKGAHSLIVNQLWSEESKEELKEQPSQ